MASPRGKLIFDDRCRFCQKSIQLLRRLDWFGTIEFVPLGQAAELMERHAITSQAMETAMHHISPLGQVTSGAEAFRVFGKLIPPLLPCALLLHLPFALRLAEVFYGKGATRRHALSRGMRCDTGHCSINRDR